MGCEIPTQIAVWEDNEDRFFNCPLKFISNESINWFEHFRYDSIFSGVALRFKDQSAKYIEAMDYFNMKLREILNNMGRETNNYSKTTDAFKSFRLGFKGKK